MILADFISLSRIILAFPLYRSIINYDVFSMWGLGIWIVLSDAIDGGLARYFGVSPWGRWLDPLADMVAITAVVWALYEMHILSLLWILFWLLRYIFYGYCAIRVLYRDGYYISAGWWNKVSICALVVFLIHAIYAQTVSPVLGCIVLSLQLVSVWETWHHYGSNKSR